MNETRATGRPLDVPGIVFLFGALLGLVFGVVDYLRFFEHRAAVVAAAWEGARQGAATELEDERLDRARRATVAALGFDSEGADVTATIWEHDGQRLLTVEVRAPYRDLIPVLPKPRHSEAAVTVPVMDLATADSE